MQPVGIGICSSMIRKYVCENFLQHVDCTRILVTVQLDSHIECLLCYSIRLIYVIAVHSIIRKITSLHNNQFI
jgi:hypothetical protein